MKKFEHGTPITAFLTLVLMLTTTIGVLFAQYHFWYDMSGGYPWFLSGLAFIASLAIRIWTLHLLRQIAHFSPWVYSSISDDSMVFQRFYIPIAAGSILETFFLSMFEQTNIGYWGWLFVGIFILIAMTEDFLYNTYPKVTPEEYREAQRTEEERLKAARIAEEAVDLIFIEEMRLPNVESPKPK
jgi:hypothetical protein